MWRYCPTEKFNKNREIITINIGGCGVNLGQTILEQYCVEQGVSSNGDKECKTQHDDSMPISFQETSKGKYYARSLFVDLDPYTINMTKNMFKYSNVIRPRYCINGKCDARNNFAAGHYQDGRRLIDTFTDRLRLAVEECDNVQGFVAVASVGGGTGAGFGTLVLERLAMDYRGKCKFGFSVFPDDKRTTSPIQVYNELLCFHWLLDHLEISIILDNQKLDEICRKQLDIKTPRYKNYNYLCNKLISTVTAPSRFAMRENLNTFQRDMVPFPRLHFLTAGLSPILPKNSNMNYKDDIQTLTDECLNYDNYFIQLGSIDAEKDKHMALSLFYRGYEADKYLFDATDSLEYMRKNKKFSFVDWMSTDQPSMKFINSTPKSLPSDDIVTGDKQVVMIGNNAGISTFFLDRIGKKYDVMYSQRAWVHHLVMYGMQEGELAEARKDLEFLEKDYLHVITVDEESDHEESD